MKSNHASFIVLNLVLCIYVLHQYGILSYLGILMILVTHELGHYICALIKGRNPELFISSSGDPGVQYDGERTVFFMAGGMIANFLFLPVFIGMEIMDMEPWYLLLLIIGGSLSDIVKIVKDLRKSE